MLRYQEKLCLLRAQVIQAEEHFRGAGYNARPPITVTADGAGVVSHAGSRLLADLADRDDADRRVGGAGGLRKPRSRHDPGRVLVDLAVAVADGAETISDIAVLADQPVLFGAVASDSTCGGCSTASTRTLGAVALGARASPGGRLGAARRAPRGARSRPCARPGGTARAGDRRGRLDRGLPRGEGRRRGARSPVD